MSVERHQTILQVSSEGIPGLLSDLRRLEQETRQIQGRLAAGEARIGSAGSPFQVLNEAQSKLLSTQVPRAYSEIERHAARTAAAELRLSAAVRDRDAITRRKNESDTQYQSRLDRLEANVLSQVSATSDAIKGLNNAYRRAAEGVARSAEREAQIRAAQAQEARDEQRLLDSRRTQRGADVAAAFGGAVVGDAESAARIKQARDTIAREALDEVEAQRRITRQRQADIQAAFEDDDRRIAQRAQAAEQIRKDEERIDRDRINRKKADAIYAFSEDRDREKSIAQQARQDAIRLAREEEADRREFNRRRRAEATEAFSQLPTTTGTALGREELSRVLATPSREPGDSDRVYRARQMLSDAIIHRATMEQRLADTVTRAEMGDFNTRMQALAAVNSAREQQAAATRRVATAEERLQRAIEIQTLAMTQGQRTSFRENFLTGFRGRGDNAPPYGEQLGQAFKFSLFYGTAYKMLFALTATLQATWTEAVAWQDAMTNLKLATGDTEEQLQGISQALANQATRAGFAPSQGLEIGARSLGLYGVVDEDRAVRERVMMQSARVVNQLAVGSGQQPVDLQGNIAAIAQSLGMGATGQFRIADLDAYMTKKFGVQQGGTLEVVAQSAAVGKAAGFSDEQLFAIAADLLSRTGQSGSAVSGYMAQIFSRGGEGSLVDVARKRGIDPTQDLADILRELAVQYQTAPGPEQAEISAAFGRGKIQNAAVALLADYDEVLQRSGEAMTQASGQADAQFALRMDNIGGQVDRLMGVMREFASQLGETGLLDVVGAGIIVFRELLETVNGVLELWNRLPDAIQDTIIGLGLLAALGKSGLLSGSLAGLRAGFIGGRDTSLLRSSFTGGRTVHEGMLYANGRLVSPTSAMRDYDPTVGNRMRAGAAGIASAGAAALGMVNPITYAIGGLLAVGALKNASDSMNEALRTGRSALRSDIGPGAGASEYRAGASELRSLARDNRNATPGWLNFLTFGQANDDNLAMRTQLRREADRLDRVANRLEARDTGAAAPERLAIASASAADVGSGLQALEAGGYTAQERLRTLNDVLFGTAAAAEAAANAFDPKLFAGENARGALKAIGGAFEGALFGETNVIGGQAGIPVTATRMIGAQQLRTRLREQLNPEEIDRRLQAGMRQAGIESEADITGEKADQVAAVVGRGVAKTVLAPYTDNPKAIRQYQRKINDAISAYLAGQTGELTNLLSGTGPLSREDAFASAQAASDLAATQLGSLPETDGAARARVLRQQIRTLRQTQRRAGGGVGEIDLMITQARRDLARTQFEELERMRLSAQQNASSKAEIIRIGRSFLRRAIRTAIRGGNADLLVEILGNAGKGAIAIARSALNEAIKVADAAVDVAQEMLVSAGYMGAQAADYIQQQIAFYKSIGMDVPQNLLDARDALRQGSRAQAEGDELRGMRRSTRNAQYDPENTMVKGLDSKNPKLDDWFGTEDEAEKDRDTPAEIAAARAAAYAVRSQSQLASARASIMSAKASLADAKKNTVEYWNAMGELFAAQQALVDAQREFALNRMRLRGDITNPLFEARVATREAAMRLRQDRRSGAGADVIAQDRVDLREARASQEATRFSQRLQAVQTAEELGRISHQKYMNYLENEKRRLEGIKNRTFQQQEQLDQIDRLMKDAANQMQGQFNLGDIKLPTPYQVRRYIEQTSPARSERMAQTAAISNQNYAFYFNGADVGVVKKVVREQVGKAGRVRGAAPRKR